MCVVTSKVFEVYKISEQNYPHPPKHMKNQSSTFTFFKKKLSPVVSDKPLVAIHLKSTANQSF